MATEESTAVAVREQSAELENRRLEGGLADGNGIIDPARWQMLAAISETVFNTAFVPAGLRGNKASTLACLLYGDSLNIQPMTALKEIHVIDGVPGMSAALMAALVRKSHPGHRLIRTELRDDAGAFQGVTIKGVRGDTGEEDTYTFTLAMATRAGLLSKANWQKYPEAMCTARASSQICTFLFPDVFMGSPLTPEELEQGEFHDVAAGMVEEGHVVVKPPAIAQSAPLRTDKCPIHGIERTELEVARGRFYCPECKLAGAEGEPPLPDPEQAAKVIGETLDHEPGKIPTEQTEWEVADAETSECITYIDAETREQLRGAAADAVVRLEGVDYEVVGFEVDGATSIEKLIVRPKPAAPGKPAAGTPDAVVKENIPEILGKWVAEAQQAGNIEFVRGVLNAEREGKNRARLVTTLEEIVAKMEADDLAKTLAGDGTGADNPLLEESESGEDEPLEGEHEEPAGFTPLEPEAALAPAAESEDVDEDAVRAGDAEIPYSALSKKAKQIRLAALCAVVEDQFPTQRAWHLSGVLGAASRQWGITAHALDDLDEEQLEAIWNAAGQYVPDAVEFLKLVAPGDVAKMGGAA